MLRRAIIATSLMTPIAACGIFTRTTTNGVTTVTIDIAKINTYVQAISNGTKTLLSIPLVSGALGAVATGIITTALADISAASAALTSEAAGAAVLTFSDASIPAALTSLQKDAATIGGAFEAVLKSQGEAAAGIVATTTDALETIVSVVQGLTLLGAAPDQAAVSQALAALGVHG